ncbi:hypothetical protein BB780_03250 [Stenotrophomonas maltophilia]|nr:hypothetical protein BB780_03250 [Stenotrophomonas maltophilia]
MPGSLLLLFIASAPAQEIVERGGTGRGRTVRRMDAPTEPYLIGIWQRRRREPAWAAVRA